MTTPRDAIGLSERLRRQGAGEDGYRTVFNGTLLEAATALDALQAENEQFRRVAIDRLDKLTKAEARVKELEADYLAVFKWHTEAAEENDELQARATSAEQERDEAYERAAKVAEQHAWSHPSAGLLGPEMNSMEIAAAIRRLAAGTEKEGE
jgi:hypothetical protein